MKKYFLLIFIVSLLNACKEDAPFIDMTPAKETLQGDTVFTDSLLAAPQLHNVLLEDITGVRCPNCPKSHEEAKSLSDANPGRIVILALHPFSLSATFTDPLIASGFGYPELRDSTADYIVTQLLGNPNNIPVGGINRKLFPTESLRNLAFSKWSGYVNSELPVATPMNLDITNSYNATTREVTAVVRMECTQDVSDTIYLSVGIKESEILGTQKSTVDTIQNYHHNHVLRKMLTPKSGLRLNSAIITLNSKQVVVRVYKYILPAAWNVNNCAVIGILHKSSSRIDVMQCAEKKIL